ncbi:hypothetical protein E2562_036648 [Oryza meyeriana var. granulata]|uniref:Uncharacterized protein n=1 Tax=Oryza meyeriana var. granulata TaxID=110450 RepID=A0A6G1D9S4_9ORYZ|nr:hypothetical protein E2562_036648 [Oryza meyeriana var. granulata]
MTISVVVSSPGLSLLNLIIPMTLTAHAFEDILKQLPLDLAFPPADPSSRWQGREEEGGGSP